jgi:hypothetical protein
MPSVLRARGFRLYLQGTSLGTGGKTDGKVRLKTNRLVDLWQCGGEAVLGHTPSQVLRELKNTAERGLFAPLPHPQERRLAKALSVLLPGRAFRFYADESLLRSALCKAGCRSEAGGAFPDPAFHPASEAPVLSLWRPFLEETLAGTAPPLLVPILPWPLAPRVLALESSLEHTFPLPPLISPLILSALTRSVYDLIAAPVRGRLHYPRITESLPRGNWRRRGIYCAYTEELPDESYALLFRRFLEGGFLLPPLQNQPLILPPDLSAGEEAQLAKLLALKQACCL